MTNMDCDEGRVEMKGIILAGGTGSRLRPLTRLINKHLLPVGKEPMIAHGIRKLAEAGLKEILVVTNRQAAGLIIDYLGSGAEWGTNLTYKIQDHPGGIAHALLLGEQFAAGGKVAVLLGDNLFEDSLAEPVESFARHGSGAWVFLKRVHDPERYGVPVFRGEMIESIVEKPAHPPSPYGVTGIYFYESDVFSIIRRLKPSARGEIEITDVNNVYAAQGRLTFRCLEGWWLDAGTFESLAEANRRLLVETVNRQGGERDAPRPPEEWRHED